ncbi:MAG: fasciclin domain-containing protein [Microcoleaceae cyanobacterium]
MTKISVMTKKAFVLLTALGSVSFLAACGGSTPTAETTTPDEPIQEQALETPDTPTAEVPSIEDTTTAVTSDEADTTATPVANDATIVAIASQDDTFSTLVAALSAADLAEVLSGEGPFTVFAPTDEAFAALPEGTVEELLKPENRDQLVKLLTYHVVPAQVASTEIASGAVETVQGEPLNVQVDEATQTVMVNNATVTQADIIGSNGVIHAIDAVMLPPSELEQ